MKKVIAILLCMLLLLSLTACGEDVEKAFNSLTKKPEQDQAAAQPETTDEEVSAEPAVEPAEPEAPVEEETPTAPSGNAAFDPITVEDNEACLIQITGAGWDEWGDYTLEVYMENKSADTTYMFSVDTAAVNGLEVDPFFASELAPGKKANEEVSFSASDLTDAGITDPTDILMHFRVYDSDNWDADDVVNFWGNFYPQGEENATVFERPAQSTDQVLVDNDSCTIIVTGFEMDEFWGYTANLYLINKTNTTLMFSADDVSVNGFMLDPFYATTVAPQCAKFSSMSWDEEDLQNNGIEQVSEIELTFTVYDDENWDAEDLLNEVFTISVN